MIQSECATHPDVRLGRVLSALGIVRSAWYAKPAEAPAVPGRKPKGVPEVLAAQIRSLAERYSWVGL